MQTVFTVGQKVKAYKSHGWSITEGKEYTVVEYQDEDSTTYINFTWPAYVTVIGDQGTRITCYAWRFYAV